LEIYFEFVDKKNNWGVKIYGLTDIWGFNHLLFMLYLEIEVKI